MGIRRAHAACRSPACSSRRRARDGAVRRGAHLQQVDDLLRAHERVRERAPAVERQRGDQAAVQLGEQDVAGGRVRVVELGEAIERGPVGGRRAPQRDGAGRTPGTAVLGGGAALGGGGCGGGVLVKAEGLHDVLPWSV